MPPTPLVRLRKLCLALPDAREVEAWGEPTFRVKTIFAMYAGPGSHHGAGRTAVWVKALEINQRLMVRADPERFFVPPYVGPSGWIGVYLDGARTDWEELNELLWDAWRMSAPKKLVAAQAKASQDKPARAEAAPKRGAPRRPLRRAVSGDAKTIDDYLALLPENQRDALAQLRRAIHAAAPDVEECISYRMPAFRLDGKVLVWFGAAKSHCSFFPGAHPIAVHARELAKYETSKGTVRFDPARPLPAALVRKLVLTRIEEQRARSPAGKKKPAAGASARLGRRGDRRSDRRG